ncbi:piwi-like protein 2 isoform X2 [Lethenteron reissneri]|nr:piwi-like protein 2 isoform X2 [Lethenteron reissneri]XP_061421206.1 piwi-like protein 2 isoform X2 [Lethenteron reissneri]XP_061421207.1 piwi-like protein 2 isoform X2 [Lethenteron reissneri]
MADHGERRFGRGRSMLPPTEPKPPETPRPTQHSLEQQPTTAGAAYDQMQVPSYGRRSTLLASLQHRPPGALGPGLSIFGRGILSAGNAGRQVAQGLQESKPSVASSSSGLYRGAETEPIGKEVISFGRGVIQQGLLAAPVVTAALERGDHGLSLLPSSSGVSYIGPSRATLPSPERAHLAQQESVLHEGRGIFSAGNAGRQVAQGLQESKSPVASSSSGLYRGAETGPFGKEVISFGRGVIQQGLLAAPGATASLERDEHGLALLPSSSGVSYIGPSRATLPSPDRAHLAQQESVLHAVLGGRGRSISSPTSSLGLQTPSETSRQPQSTSVESGSSTSLESTFSKLSVATLPVEKPIQKIGTYGSPLEIATNYIRLRCSNEAIYQYHVTFSPEVDSTNTRFGLLNEHKSVIGNTKAFDGCVLYLPRKLDDNLNLTSKRNSDGVEITLSIKCTKIIEPDSDLCLPIYNIIFKKIMRLLELKLVGKSFLNPRKPIVINRYRIHIWPGYIVAVQKKDGGLMLMLDVSHRVLRMDSVLEVMTHLYESCHSGANFQEECIKALVGQVVITRYNNRTYRIDDIAWDKTPKSTFLNSAGKTMSFVEYYKTQYEITIDDLGQPLLLHRAKQRNQADDQVAIQTICLIPELAYMTGITDLMRSDFSMMKAISEQMRLGPSLRHNSVMEFISTVENNPEAQQELSNWGLQLDSDIYKLSGRQLPPEMIRLQSKAFAVSPEADWTRHIVNTPCITAVAMKNWQVLCTQRDSFLVREFVNMMCSVGPPMGLVNQFPNIIELPNDQTKTYVDCIRKNYSYSQGVQMIMCIFSTLRDDRYSTVKQVCCVELAVPSQVVQTRTISQQKRMRSVAQKVVLQMNCKLGGELWILDIPLKNIMVVGVDVFHNVVLGKQSVVGFVASMNRSVSRWYSRVVRQSTAQELVDGLNLCMTSAIKKYYELNHFLPEKIIMYRDGVSDSQLAIVRDFEVMQLTNGFRTFDLSYQPKMLVVVVQKRINTNIFFNNNGAMENAPPGSVLDTVATSQEWFDFFLVSQHVRQGTVSPTHYVVIFNSLMLGADHIQRLTYKMTHLYYNWSGTVRVPAPCQYAHKLASLVGENLHSDPDPGLCDKLFFL